MHRVVPVITSEELNSDNPETRVWHAADIKSKKAACGLKGRWAGAGLIVTCPECIEKVGSDPLHLINQRK